MWKKKIGHHSPHKKITSQFLCAIVAGPIPWEEFWWWKSQWKGQSYGSEDTMIWSKSFMRSKVVECSSLFLFVNSLPFANIVSSRVTPRNLSKVKTSLQFQKLGIFSDDIIYLNFKLKCKLIKKNFNKKIFFKHYY